MPKTLAELRQSQNVGLQTRVLSMCLAQKLVGEVQVLNEERMRLIESSAAAAARTDRGADGEAPVRPRRAGEGLPPRLVEIEARLEEIAAAMNEDTGQLHLTAVEQGAWRRFAQDNPAREIGRTEDGEPIMHPVDQSIGYGFVNADAVFDDLFRYVTAWNDEDLDEDTWHWIVSNAAGGDLNDAVRLVVQMHEFTGFKAPHREGSRL